MNLFLRFFKILQSQAHSLVSKFEDPIKMTEQGIRDLKEEFDKAMQGVAEVKAIAIGAKNELEAKKQIVKDYEQKALIILQKAQNKELDEQEADRLASEALKKKQTALSEIKNLTENINNYNASLEVMEKNVLELKKRIKNAEEEYNTLKARATVAKTTKKINKQLSSISSDSTTAMLEEMKTKIQTEENLAIAYGENAKIETSIDDEINNAIGENTEVQSMLEDMKKKLLANPLNNEDKTDNVDDMKKELDS